MGELRPDFKLGEELKVSASEIDADTDEARDETVPPKPTAMAPKKKAVRNARNHPQAKEISLKGIAYNTSRSLAMISCGSQHHTIGVGEAVDVRLPKGMIKVRCQEIMRSSVVLLIDGEPVELRLH